MRRLVALIEGLPSDAAVWRPDRRGWSQELELQAWQIETTDLWGRILALTLGQERHALPAPPVLDHAGRHRGDAARRRPTTDPAEMKQFFQRR